MISVRRRSRRKWLVETMDCSTPRCLRMRHVSDRGRSVMKHRSKTRGILAASFAFALAGACVSSSATSNSSDQATRKVAYPTEALRLRQEGDVRLSMCIAPDGKTREVKIVQSSGSEALDRASVEGASRATMTPGTDSAGKPIDWCNPPFEMTVSWRLPK